MTVAPQTITRDIPALELRGVVVPESINTEERSVEVVWTTGARVLRGFWERYWEELSLDPKHVRMGRMQSGSAAVLDAHARWSIRDQIGVVATARLEAKQGVSRVRFSRRADVEPIWQDVKDGIVQNVSVGYAVHRMEKIEDGADKIPVYRATDWEPTEVSFVPVGADAGAGVRSEGRVSAPAPTNPCIFVTRSQEQTMPETPAVPVPPPTPQVPAEPARAEDLEAVRAEAAKAERERTQTIRNLVQKQGLDDAVADDLVARGVPVDQARVVVLDKLAERSDAIKTDPHIRVGEDASDKWKRGVSAWLFEKAGNGLVKRAKELKAPGFENVDLDGGEFRGMKIIDIARMCVERGGGSLRGVYNDFEILRRALTTRGTGGMATTSDFSVLFENVMFKQMRASYETQPHTWRRWMGTDTVSNFLTHSRFLNGSFGTLPVVAEHGEYKNIAIPDGAKNTISTETRGAIIAISRQAMINDDMGALSDVAVRFGLTAGRSIEVQAYAMLGLNSGLGPTMADSQPFFHANRANVATSAALTVAGIDADKVKMRDQKDISSNDYLDLVPSILLVPVGLESAAKVINNDAYDHDGSNPKYQKTNVARGLFTDIVSSPRLSWSTTRRYLFTAAKEAFKVVFLEGSGEGPVMESQEGFRVDGLEWKARIDFKVNAYDPKTAITNAGT